MKIVFTKHTHNKFSVLARHGIKLSRVFVEQTVRNPEIVDKDRHPLLIAQCSIDTRRVLRVVYKKEGSNLKIITFYPGRKSQYEKNS